MRTYLIVNDADFDGFYDEVRNLQAMGLSFKFSYINSTTDKPETGGWGALKFSADIPPGKLFDGDDVEYRWSDSDNAWTVNGVIAEDQSFLEGLYNYFVQMMGND